MSPSAELPLRPPRRVTIAGANGYMGSVKLYVDQGIVNSLTDAEQAAIAEYLKSL